MRRGHTTENRGTRFVTLERNSNGPRARRKCKNQEKTFSSETHTHVVRRSKETSRTSSPKKKRRKKLHYIETPSHRLPQVKIKVVNNKGRVETVKTTLDTQFNASHTRSDFGTRRK